MTFPILPLVSSAAQCEPFAFAGQVLLPLSDFAVSKLALSAFPPSVKVNVDVSSEIVSCDEIVELLNVGVAQIFVAESQFELAVDAGLPLSRFAVVVSKPTEALLKLKAAIVVSAPLDDVSIQAAQKNNRIVYFRGSLTQRTAEALAQNYVLVVPAQQLETAAKQSQETSQDKINVASVFVSTLTTDRPDGLYTTLVADTNGAALGVVYSSDASIAAAIETQEGVFQSRKRPHELWYKGKTSGATQRLVKLERDCDCDVVKFVVALREGFGFCHVEENYTCFGDGNLAEGTDSYGSGLARLDATLAQRIKLAPEGLYTKRLFEDKDLLVAKMKEELDELIEAGASGNRAETAFEAADLLYFAMAYCVRSGVRLADIERSLDIKSMRVTRRKGDAKEKYIAKTEEKTDAAEQTAKEKKPESEKTAAEEKENTYAMEVLRGDFTRALSRPVQATADIMKLVLPIIEQVQRDGDKALLELTGKFDGVKLESPVLEAPFPSDLMQISEDMKHAIDLSMSNIEKFHRAQMPAEAVMTVETSPGVFCSRFAKPIENVGLYVPGGTAVLPSTAMMLGVPAKVAGCRNIVVASPPSRATGRLTPEVVYVAHRLGALKIVMAGGAQAVAAMAYGTESVVKCDKILGPGNQFVTAAKMHVQNDTKALCSIDMPAGPSEVLVVADEKADADFVASDLLSQAEHGVDSQVILVGIALSDAKLREIEEAVRRQAEVLPRKDIVAKCLAHSYTLLVDSVEEAFKVSNDYAPEHLILQLEDAEKYVPSHVENAGLVFVGGLSPESCGDYLSGTNHTLPTYGYARQYSGVNTATFQKFITAQKVTEQGLRSIGNAVMTLAAVEGLEAHRNAVQVRMDKLGLSS